MSGHGHIVTTGAVVAAVLVASEARGWTHLGLEAVLFVVVAMGAALLPDIDLSHSTAGTMWGPISEKPLKLIEPLLAAPERRRWPLRHRWVTHDPLVGPSGFALAAYFAPTSAVIAVTTGLTLAVAARLEILHLTWPLRLALSVCAGTATLVVPLDFGWLPVAVWVGSLLHIAEDRLSNIVPQPGETLQYALFIR